MTEAQFAELKALLERLIGIGHETQRVLHEIAGGIASVARNLPMEGSPAPLAGYRK